MTVSMPAGTMTLSEITQACLQLSYADASPQTWMRRLRPQLKRLRQSYRKDAVQVQYGDDRVAKAYMLAYAPYHIWQTYQVLDRLRPAAKSALLAKKRITIAGFCSGPGPELMALQWFLLHHQASCEQIDIAIYDKNAHSWKKNASYAAVQFPNIKASWRYEERDINGFSIWNVALQQADIVFIQNCFNELNTNNKSLCSLLRSMKVGASLLCSDLSSYSGNIHQMKQLSTHLNETHRSSPLQNHKQYRFDYSDDVERHLFAREDGLWARRRLEFTSMILERK